MDEKRLPSHALPCAFTGLPLHSALCTLHSSLLFSSRLTPHASRLTPHASRLTPLAISPPSRRIVSPPCPTSRFQIPEDPSGFQNDLNHGAPHFKHASMPSATLAAI